MNEWDNYLHKVVEREKQRNIQYYKACKQCGDKGYFFEVIDSGIGYNCIVMNPCVCVSGVQLRERWNRKEESK